MSYAQASKGDLKTWDLAHRSYFSLRRSFWYTIIRSMRLSAAAAATASPWVPVLAAVVGAGAALVVGILTQFWTGRRENIRWSREREDRKEQWGRERQDRLDDSLRELCSDFAGTARELLHLARRVERSSDKELHRKRIDDVHLRLRSLNEQIRLLANRDVQRTAQFVVHHGYAVREVIAEKRPDERSAIYGKPVEVRYLEAVREFYKAVRKQLGVPDAEELASFEAASDDPLAENREKGDDAASTAT
jgi:hypothetical protein